MSDLLQHQEIQELLRSYLRNSFIIPSNDPLANVFSNGIISLKDREYNLDSTWEKLSRIAKNIEKEFGINPLCIAQGTVSLNWKEKNYHLPIVLSEAQIKIDRLAQKVFMIESDEKSINPFLIHFFDKEFNLKIPNEIDEIFAFFYQQSTIEVIKDASYIGNFHPHRFEIIREIESLLDSNTYSESLQQILGLNENTDFKTIPFSSNKLISADPDQMEALIKIQTENCVVQGPPGTGKSQVIVNLLGKLLESEKTTLVVSEKRVALDVIEKKMNSLNLSGLCYTTTSHFSNSDFIYSLKKEWQRLELMASTENQLHTTHSFLIQDLQNLLNLLHQPELANGKTIIEFLKEFDQNKSKDLTGFSSDLPDLKEWGKIKPTLEFIYENQLIHVISQLKTERIEKSFLLSIESKITNWKKQIKKLTKVKTCFTYAELYNLARNSILFSKFESHIFKKFGSDFLSSNAKQKKLQKVKIELQAIQIQLDKLELENAHWIQNPTKAEIDYLLHFFQSKGLLTRFNQSRNWKKWTRSSFLNPIECLNSRMNQIILEEKKKEIILSLSENNIENIQDLEEVLALYRSISKEEIIIYNQLTSEEKEFYKENQKAINQLITEFKLYFAFEDETDLANYISVLEKDFFKLLENHEKFEFVSKHLSILAKRFRSIQEAEQHILASTWSKLKMDFPKLIDFSWDKFYEKVEDAISIENRENKLFRESILQKQKEKFDTYHSLLITSSVKLKQQNKELKQQLKEGKRILVKEFSKSRNHLSIRALMESNAKIWIELLKPIWLVNPTRLATCFPSKHNLFSMAIFDEASQIPLENALGALQRAERVLIAGDPQQMSPSSYFSGQKETIDLLHQASFYLPNLFLSYHYRSYHPELISFSNTHFYQNRLHAFQHADFEENPVQLTFVKNAFFDNRVNKQEAHAVAQYVTQKINSNQTLGIVAFSESQLQAIYSEFSPNVRNQLQDKLEADEFFFKSIENVQGDECDELIVSFGYGYSEQEGSFAMRFGPMNLSNGSKRLNVLLSRARKKIHFFTSVKSTDFKNSSNETVNLIRKWFQKLESPPNLHQSKTFDISFRKLVEENNNILIINTLMSIYKDRKWNVLIQ